MKIIEESGFSTDWLATTPHLDRLLLNNRKLIIFFNQPHNPPHQEYLSPFKSGVHIAQV